MTFASLHTVDGQFGSGANATKGREALKTMIAGPRQRQASAQPAVTRPPMYHTTANHQITFTDKDHARIDAYHITLVSAAWPDTRRAWPVWAAASTSWSA